MREGSPFAPWPERKNHIVISVWKILSGDMKELTYLLYCSAKPRCLASSPNEEMHTLQIGFYVWRNSSMTLIPHLVTYLVTKFKIWTPPRVNLKSLKPVAKEMKK